MRNIAGIATVIALMLLKISQVQSQSVMDVDGNVYKTVILGNKTVMAENLKTTRFSNGDSIGTTNPATLDISDYSAPNYQWAYNGDEKNVPVYGRLYTWYAITDNRKICPVGWHVPGNDEWFIINDGFGGKHKVWVKVKTIFGWNDPNAGAISETEFSGEPAGGRNDFGEFDFIGIYGNWWSSSSKDALNSKDMAKRGYIYGGVAKFTYLKNYACSVRCILDY